MNFVATTGHMGMADDRDQIRTLMERWAEAAHAAHLDTVLADHADDIVMFTLPPPPAASRALVPSRERCPAWFGWQARGAACEAGSLDIPAGNGLALSRALLRSGAAEEL